MSTCHCSGSACPNTSCPAHPNYTTVTVTPSVWTGTTWTTPQLTPERVREIFHEELAAYEVDTTGLESEIRSIARDELNKHLLKIEENVKKDVKDQVGKAITRLFAGNDHVDIVRKAFIGMIGEWHRALNREALEAARIKGDQ